jgi:hypothetical protein
VFGDIVDTFGSESRRLPFHEGSRSEQRERAGVRVTALTIGRNPSPGSHLAMRSDLSRKGRGEVSPGEPITLQNTPNPPSSAALARNGAKAQLLGKSLET